MKRQEEEGGGGETKLSKIITVLLFNAAVKINLLRKLNFEGEIKYLWGNRRREYLNRNLLKEIIERINKENYEWSKRMNDCMNESVAIIEKRATEGGKANNKNNYLLQKIRLKENICDSQLTKRNQKH